MLFNGKLASRYQLIKNSLSITTVKEKKLLVLMYFINVISSLSEVGGIGLIYVFFTVIINIQDLNKVSYINDIYNYFDFQNSSNFLLFLAITVLVIFTLRNLFHLWGTWAKLDIRRKIQYRISTLLYDTSIGLPYTSIQTENTSRLISNITANSSSAITHCTIGVVEILSSITLLSLFLFMLVIAKPIETITSIPIIFIIYSLYWSRTRQLTSKWGRSLIQTIEKNYQVVTETFLGIKTIKVFNTENYFKALFKDNIHEYMNTNVKNGFIQQVPKILMETILVIVIMSSIIILILNGSDTTNIIPTLTLFGGAALRMVPAASKIVSDLQQFSISSHALESIRLSLKKSPTNKTNPKSHLSFSNDTPGISLKNVYFKYEDNRDWLIQNMNLEIHDKSFIGFVGHSGSGKTTVADLILGLLSPQIGQILHKESFNDHKLFFSYVPQEPFIIDSSIKENIALGIPTEEVDETRLIHAINKSSLRHVVERLPEGLYSSLGERGTKLSGGERQRLGIARALYFNSPFIVLDEPTSALDSKTESEILDDILKLRGEKTIILIAHRLNTIALCDKIYYFEKGQIESHGTIEQLSKNSSGFREILEKYKSNTENL
ncbi:ABC transporter ATP-binding protein [Kiloniella majae]|uniref:ABC transporter ATP-binding protein n=1 Tax=Kiloniella majae TaxID=1938558 RepID=UPI000A279550|nr:ABC transporter ATP-binding protein [Kiloniella majae]